MKSLILLLLLATATSAI